MLCRIMSTVTNIPNINCYKIYAFNRISVRQNYAINKICHDFLEFDQSTEKTSSFVYSFSISLDLKAFPFTNAFNLQELDLYPGMKLAKKCNLVHAKRPYFYGFKIHF